MIKKITIQLFIALLTSVIYTNAQDIFLANDTVSLGEIVVTATKTNQDVDKIPGRAQLISPHQIENFPAAKADDYLRFVSGVNTNRTTGIYTMRPTVTLRGITNEQGRTLILMDGVPLNMSNGGSVNWNRIHSGKIERIEVFKGPGSSLYGNNAMGGVINLISRQPSEPFEGEISALYGTFNTIKPELYFGGRVNKQLSWSLSGFYQTSDGYNSTPEDQRREPDYTTARFLDEESVSLNVKYQLSELFNVSVQGDYYNDKRGEGEKIEAPDGEYRKFSTLASTIKIDGQSGDFKYDLNLFGQREEYFRIDERMRGGSYSRFDVESDRDDMGAIFNSSYQISPNNTITGGLEYKTGSSDAADIYKTSDDIIINRGSLEYISGYLQDEWTIIPDQLRFIGGIRIDRVRYFDGEFHANAASGASSHLEALNEQFDENTWEAFSPRLALRHHAFSNASIYASYSRGFRAPILEDLTRSGIMRGRYITANPQLGPEYLDNYELGMNIRMGNLTFEPTIFHSIGSDFQYYIATGDSLTFGGSLRSIDRRENITQVKITGVEMDFRYHVNPNLILNSNYTYNHSTIDKYQSREDLEGKHLMYTPKHSAKAGILWSNPWVNTSINALFKDRQFTSDDNEDYLDEFFTIDLMLSKKLFDNKANVSLIVHDLFDNKRLETANALSPGRITNLKLSYTF